MLINKMVNNAILNTQINLLNGYLMYIQYTLLFDENN